MKVAHINIIRNNIEEVKLLLYICRFDTLAITETYLNCKISNSQLEIENYKMVRRDRSLGMVGGGCLVYVANHLCFTRLKSFESTDIEGIWLKIMFDLSALIVGSIYRPPSDSEFFQRFYITLEKVWLKHRNVIVIGDLNADFTKNRGEVKSAMGKRLHNILQHFDYSVVNDQPTRITSETSTLINLVIASMPNTIKCTKTLELGISHHLLVYALVKNKIKRPPPKVVTARSYKMLRKDVEEAPWAVISVFDDSDDSFWAWSYLFNEMCDRHAPYRQVKIRQQSLPWITPQIRHLMNLSLKTFLKAKKSNSQELWSEYRSLRNRVTQEVRLSKSEYYTNLFDEVKDCRSYWKLVKSSSGSRTVQPVLDIRGSDQVIETSDSRKAEILNEYFSTIGGK